MSYLITIFILIIIILILMNLGKIRRVIVYQSEKRRKVEESKNKVLELFKDKNKITNDEVQKLLDVSDATATRYLDELEKEGKIKQVGKEGRYVYYEII